MEVEVGRDGILLETFFANPMLPCDDINCWQVVRYTRSNYRDRANLLCHIDLNTFESSFHVNCEVILIRY